MTPKKQDFDEPIMTHREMLRKLIDQQRDANLELIKLSHVVYGNPDAEVLGLVGDNKKNKEYIENDKRWKWTAAGFLALLVACKDYILKLFH